MEQKLFNRLLESIQPYKFEVSGMNKLVETKFLDYNDITVEVVFKAYWNVDDHDIYVEVCSAFSENESFELTFRQKLELEDKYINLMELA